MIYLDFETRSACDISTAGAWTYSEHPSTKVLCMCWAKDDNEVQLWLPGQPVPKEFFKEKEFEAHNASFEQAIWNNICVPQHGFPKLEIENWHDSMALCAYYGYPLSLDAAAEALGLREQKDKEGYRIMLQLSQPRSPLKKERDAWMAEYGEDVPMPVLWHDLSDPKVKPKFERMCQYCAQDVIVERAISQMLGGYLPPAERAVWKFDQKFNQRGVPIDVPTVKKCIEIRDRFATRAVSAIRSLTDNVVLKPTLTAKLKEWIESKGVPCESLTKDSMEKMLLNKNLPERVRKVLELRRSSGKTSTAKLDRMLQCSGGATNSVRYSLQYHGAITGRWAGRLIQVHNFPKGDLPKDQTKQVVDDLVNLSVDDIMEKYDNPMQVISSCLRSMIKARKGKKFVAADASQIEARIVFWYAGETDALNMFRCKEDIYLDMAKYVFKDDSFTKEKNNTERQLGKQIILGCFGPDTKVLCKTGWKRIIDVHDSDLVWDGVEWVSHKGLKYQGQQFVQTKLGVSATPDHKFLVGPEEWAEWQEVHTNPSLFQKALDSASLPSLNGVDIPLEREKVRGNLCASVPVDGRGLLREVLSKKAAQLGAMLVRKSKQLKLDFESLSTSSLSKIHPTENGFSTGFLPVFPDATIQKTPTIGTMEDVESMCGTRGGKTDSNFYNTSSPWRDGTYQNWNWTVLTWIKGMSRTILGLLLGKLICRIVDVSKIWNDASENLNSKMPVYDLYMCGPRNRFTILTEKGPVIVHNCGFGMGVNKFMITCAGYGLDVDEKLAAMAVNGYRKKYSLVPKLWAAVEEAAVRAISTGGTYTVNDKLTFYMKGNFLVIKLPTGREMHYPNASIVKHNKEFYVHGRKKVSTSWAPSFMTTDLTGRKMIRTELYGGLIVENIVQATARDCLIGAMFKAEKQGYETIFSVHDEIITEVPDSDEYTHTVLEDIMSQSPKWAPDLPLASEGWTGYRYKK